MPQAQRFAELLSDLQRLERASILQGSQILDAFVRHTSFNAGALYLRDGEAKMKLAASSAFEAPEEWDRVADQLRLIPEPQLVLPIRSHREEVGVLALGEASAEAEDDHALAHAAVTFLGTVMTNQRLLQETREGDFQLKYRLWELESLYDIGLSIASTLNIDELADEILFRMISLTNARRAALYLRDGSKYVLYRSFGDVKAEFLTDDLADQIIREGAPLAFEDQSDCIFPQCTERVAVPIKGNNEVIGILAAADRETREGGIGAFEANELRLLGLFANQVAIALENARLHKAALEKQAMERELELAATIQTNILPKKLPDSIGMEISVLARPARQVGGDYHAFFEQDGVLTVVVADVAGKSMPAALLVSALHAAVQLLFAEGRELSDIATELNKHIHRWSAENKFITLIIVAIDREHDTIQFVNAGHNPSYLIVDGQLDTLKSNGLPIGIMPSSRYTTQTRPFPRGAAVVLYSDGITEAENLAGDEFDNPRLEEILTRSSAAPAEDLKREIAVAVDAFVGEAPQKDDQTLVVVRRRE